MFRLRLEILKENIYLIIPIICIGMWALFNLIHNLLTINSFIIINNDFSWYYYSGKNFLLDPSDLYNPKRRYYLLPAFAMLLSVTISLFPLLIAQYIFYIINLILAIIFTLEYNKILVLMKVKKKIYRFIFLIIVSNSWYVYGQFYQNQYKYIMGVIILFILRQEIQNRIKEKEKDLKYYIINYGLFVFAVGLVPPMIFFLLIYIFQDIHFNDIFKKYNVKKYGMVLLMFSIQNFIVFIYPHYFLDMLGLYIRWNTTARGGDFPLFYLREWVILDSYIVPIIISTILISIVTFFFILNNKMKLEEKFIYFSIICLDFYMFAGRGVIILFPLAILYYIPFLNQDEISINFIKRNRFILIGLSSISAILLMPRDFTIYKYFPVLQDYPYFILINLRLIFFLFIFNITIIILYIQKCKNKDKNPFPAKKNSLNYNSTFMKANIKE